MREKKQSKSWYVAATHYLTAGFAIPFVLNMLLALLVSNFFSYEQRTYHLFWLLLIVVSKPFAVWLGVMYSARYVRKTYIVTDPVAVVRLSTRYFVVLSALVTAYLVFAGSSAGAIDLVVFVASTAVFYLASKKYLVQTSPAATPTRAST